MKQFLQLIRPFREMRKIAALSFVLFALLAIPMGMRGQTTEIFTLSSADEVTQNGITVSFAKGSGSNAPAWYSAGLRLYASNTVTISSTNTITGISFNWEKQGSKEFASATTEVGTYSHPNTTGIGTWSGSANEVVFTLGNSGQLQLNTFSVTVGGSPATATTVTIDASGITNTDVYTNTEAGSLSATITETESGDEMSSATVTWSGNNDAVATINASTGAVTLVSAGSVTFTASYAGETGTYQASSATYEMTVTNSAPYVQPTEIEITPNYTFWGQTAQFSGSTYSELSGSKDNLTLNWTRGTGSTYANQNAMRFYKDNTLTFTAPTGYEIKSIIITFSQTQNDLTFLPEGYVLSESIGSWTGSSATVTMSRPSSASSYAQITQFVITIGLSSSIVTPTFTPASGTEFGDDGLSVTISCETEGADIFYTLDGTTPDNTSTLYNGAINLTTTTTISAIAYDGTDYSNVATATYTYVDPNAPGTQNNPYTVAQARAAIDANSGTQGVYATGIVSQVDSYNGNYNSITYWISDDGTTTNQLEAYGGISGIDDWIFSSVDDIEVGATVVIYGNLKKYNTTYEFDVNNELVSYTAPVHAVEAPTFNPTAGTYTEAQTVTISCATEGATIYYTTDGTEPTNESDQYTEPISVTEYTTIKAVAYLGTESSTVASATYHFCSANNPYTVTEALAFNEYPANDIYVHGIVSTAPTSLSNGTLTYYISVDGEATNQLEIYKGKDLENQAFTSVDDIQVGDIVTVYGNVQVYSGTIEFGSGNYLVSFERPVVPVINASNTTIAYDATSGSIAYTIDNPVEGVELSASTDAEWISGLAVGEESITFTCTANEGTADRTATITLSYQGAVNVEITVIQGHYVADYATLPFEFYGGRADIATTAGMTQGGLDSDYGSSPKLKFNSTDDWVILHFNETPGTLSYDIKGNSFSEGTFTVQTSEDGVTYSDLATYTELGATQTEAFTSLGSSVRYIKWIYTNKSSGNVALGNIVLDKPCEKIVLNESHPTWSENFDSLTTSTTPFTGMEPRCWTVVRQYFSGSTYYEGGVDTLPQLYYNPSFAHSGNYSYRIKYRSLVAMPELQLDETVDLSRVRLSMWVRQPQTYYKLQVGVLENINDESSFVPVALVDNSDATVTYFECGFENYTGNGRYIAFKNVGGSTSDPYCSNYLDDITLTLEPEVVCGITALPYPEGFEGYTYSAGETGVEPTCWTLVEDESGTMTTATKPQVYKGYAASGSYSLRLKNRGVYAMPELNVPDAQVKDLSMTFSLRQPQTFYCLQVGVVNESGEFEVVKEINNATTGMETVTVNFSSYSGNGNLIAFRNMLRNSANYAYSYNYIDNIVLDYSTVECGVTATYTENFDGYTTTAMTSTGVEPDCWMVVDEDVALTDVTRPQVCYGYSTSGNYSLRLKNRCVYAMPEVVTGVEVKDLEMTFQLRQPYSFYLLEVGVVDSAGNFELVEEVNNASQNFEPVTVSFANYTGTGKRIAFHNILRNAANYEYSYNYIDDISITTATSKNADVTGEMSDAMENDRYLDNIAVYPNPTTGVLHIDAVDVQKVECYSQMGQLVGVYDNVNELNISELADGVYMLRITVPQGVTMRKVVKK